MTSRQWLGIERGGYSPDHTAQDKEWPMPDDRVVDSADDKDVDPIDREAAQIDPRREDAPEEIEKLIEHARDLGRDVPGDGTPPS